MEMHEQNFNLLVDQIRNVVQENNDLNGKIEQLTNNVIIAQQEQAGALAPSGGGPGRWLRRWWPRCCRQRGRRCSRQVQWRCRPPRAVGSTVPGSQRRCSTPWRARRGPIRARPRGTGQCLPSRSSRRCRPQAAGERRPCASWARLRPSRGPDGTTHATRGVAPEAVPGWTSGCPPHGANTAASRWHVRHETTRQLARDNASRHETTTVMREWNPARARTPRRGQAAAVYRRPRCIDLRQSLPQPEAAQSAVYK